MAVEGPEAHILAGELDEALTGRRVVSLDVHDVARLQPTGFVNSDLCVFESLIGDVVTQVQARGNTLLLTFESGSHLVLGPENGARILVHRDVGEMAGKTHLVMVLDDEQAMTIRLTGMASLRFESAADLAGNYLYRRDYAGKPDPVIDRLSADDVEEMVGTQTRSLKSVLVGRDAVMVGIFNGLFSDMMHRAGLHPRRRAADLSLVERRRLAASVVAAVTERTRRGGHTGFVDVHGTPGRYEPPMGPGRRDTTCPRCGTLVDAVTVGGARVYFCPACQT